VPQQIWGTQLCLILHPGIEGDRGPSSLDWAIDNNLSQWGVTLLQANAEMDAGDIWETKNFSMRSVAKASLYRREVISTAVELIKNTVHKIIDIPKFIPRPLDYSNPQVLGQCLPLMRQDSRKIGWHTDTTEVVMRKINAADSFPGVMDKIDGQDVYLFGARAEAEMYLATPGEIVGHRDSAICRVTIDGSVWIRQLKLAGSVGKMHFKLPALQVLNQLFPNALAYAHLNALESKIQNDIQVHIKNRVAYLSFDFYNGAMCTEQCQQLLATIRLLNTNDDVRVIALMGGEDFWSNGIHLNCIQAANDPALESWRNNAASPLIFDTLSIADRGDRPNIVSIAIYLLRRRDRYFLGVMNQRSQTDITL
jgi:putative two-component system protein, hydrogenase maturation factor HypX/HoxX